ncbi:MAG: beta-N-acetylhexosaminidase [Bacteroidales bacterium]|nr:beta-N-acetylhexosaminidase [Bacteroidales bacterium]
MKKIAIYLFVLLLGACTRAPQVDIPALIPVPVTLEAMEGSFELNTKTKLVVNLDDSEMVKLAAYLNEQLVEAVGFHLELVGHAGKNAIRLDYGKGSDRSLVASDEQGVTSDEQMAASDEQIADSDEYYEMDIDRHGVQIIAGAPQGLFYGIQTLMQLIPLGDECAADDDELLLPDLHIEDYPRFAWRGLMLDVSRHFFTVDEVKAYIDEMAKYKFNIFHWHLTDDQGWRVEIKSLPKLTEIGAWRVPRTGQWWTYDPAGENEKATYGGYYTQDQIREVVKYASDRFIQILPEVDVPGHSLAMIATYPQLSSTGKQYHVNPGSKFYRIEDNSLNPAKEEVYEVMDKVFTEIAELFPYEYVHIGGDECNKSFWKNDRLCRELMKKEGMSHVNELQSYFIKRMEKILQSKGKKLIGWDEILEGGLAPDAYVMSWRGMKGGIKAAQMGHKVVMTPTTHCYLDLYQGDPQVEPITYSMLRLRDVYSFEPVPDGVDSELILGGQGNLWSESVYTLGHAQYMTWPRGFALAEVLWSEKEDQDWEGFVDRVEEHFKRLDAQGVNYAVSVFDPIVRLKAQGSGLKAQGSGLKAQGSRLKGQGSRLKGQGSSGGDLVVMETEAGGFIILLMTVILMKIILFILSLLLCQKGPLFCV